MKTSKSGLNTFFQIVKMFKTEQHNIQTVWIKMASKWVIICIIQCVIKEEDYILEVNEIIDEIIDNVESCIRS